MDIVQEKALPRRKYALVSGAVVAIAALTVSVSRLESGPPSDAYVAVEIEDDGPGLVSTANLFTPFFTTKPNGSGIGLALSRQIIEAHGGTVEQGNRVAARGCLATIRLPVGAGGAE